MMLSNITAVVALLLADNATGRPQADMDRVPVAVVLSELNAAWGDHQELRRLMRVLRTYADPLAVAEFERRLMDVDEVVRELAAYALNRKRVEALLHAVADAPSTDARLEALHVLSWLQYPETAPALRECLGDQDLEVRYQSALALAAIGDFSVLPLLEEASRSPDPKVRGKLASLLADVDHPKAVEILFRLASEDHDPWIAYYAMNDLYGSRHSSWEEAYARLDTKQILRRINGEDSQPIAIPRWLILLLAVMLFGGGGVYASRR